MKKYILLLGVLLFLQGCSGVEDDFGNGCVSDCTVINGHFVTAGNVPLGNVRLELDFHNSSMFSSVTRNIVSERTGDDGFYSMGFYIKDNELAGATEGFFRLQADFRGLDMDRYIVHAPVTFIDYLDISSRDTIIERTFYVPTKATIKVNLSNFNPVALGDSFRVFSSFPSGAKVEDGFLETDYQGSGFGIFAEDVLNQTISVVVAERETNVIKIHKNKNGVVTTEEFELYVPEHNAIVLNYNY